MEAWIAKDLLYKYRFNLCGIIVLTEDLGIFPGGLAEIIEIEPDPNAPEISFNVHSFYNNEEFVMGIFEWENIQVYKTDQSIIYSF